MTVSTDTAGAWEPTTAAVEAAVWGVVRLHDASLQRSDLLPGVWEEMVGIARAALIAAHPHMGEGA